MNSVERGHRWGVFLALALVVLVVQAGCAGPGAQKKQPEQAPDAMHSVRLANSQFSGGRVSEALATLDAAILLEPDNATLHNYYGLLCLQAGRYESAVAPLQRALEIDPYLTDAHNVLGTVYTELGSVVEAEQQFRKALEDPAYPTPEKVYMNLGLLYGSQGRNTEAVKSFRKSVGIAPDYLKAHFHLASILDQIGNLKEAATEYEVAEPAFRNDGEYWYRRGFAYYRLGRTGAALDSLSRVRAVAPGSESAARAAELLEMLD